MAYIVYLSRPKIDMLYEQLGEKEAEYSAEGTFSFKAFMGKIARTFSTKRNIYQKLERTIESLDSVGDVFDKKASYITGKMPMRWASFKNGMGATFWIGETSLGTNISKVLLIGSAKNIHGAKPAKDAPSFSPLNCFMQAYAEEVELNPKFKRRVRAYSEESMRPLFRDLEDYAKSKYGFSTEYRFLAKTLCKKRYKFGDGTIENLIIASPLYVTKP